MPAKRKRSLSRGDVQLAASEYEMPVTVTTLLGGPKRIGGRIMKHITNLAFDAASRTLLFISACDGLMIFAYNLSTGTLTKRCWPDFVTHIHLCLSLATPQNQRNTVYAAIDRSIVRFDHGTHSLITLTHYQLMFVLTLAAVLLAAVLLAAVLLGTFSFH